MTFSLSTHKDDEDCAAASKKELRSAIKTFECAANELRAAIEVAATSSPTLSLVSAPHGTVVERGAQSSDTLSLSHS